ncbi:MAG: 4-alpha-glucanotransferase, partial [Peptococcaceae bacterium]|nr:4-alpha-glucanotransferase [Peptococcaceae bacterium]
MDRIAPQFPRSAGVLLHISSLPSPYGIGSFGKSAYQWVDFLREAGQSYWQILPLGPTGYGNSPYQCFSAFAGNPYFIDLDMLCKEGLLKREDFLDLDWGMLGDRVDFDAVYRFREPVLRKAFTRFMDEAALDGFIRENPWLADYCLFMAVKDKQGKRSWQEWEAPLRLRQGSELEKARAQLEQDIRYHAFVQYQFDRQWQALRTYANDRGIRIIGDIPIYVSPDSADVWASPELFQLDENAVPIEVSGCPPDYFSEDGQLWGNPLYNWDAMSKTGYEWWIRRLKHNFTFYDVLRIDHFRGLESYYAIPYGDETARGGQWKPGPGMDFIRTVQAELPDADVIAEDLGFFTEAVQKLLADSAYPGMKLLEFAFDAREGGDYSPYTYEANTVVYTGTHDNDTVEGWGKTAPRRSVRLAMEY